MVCYLCHVLIRSDTLLYQCCRGVHFIQKCILWRCPLVQALANIYFLFLFLFLSSGGVSVFGSFLRSEFSEENLQFYLACEQYKHSSNNFSLQRRAKDICATYIQPGSPREVQLCFHPAHDKDKNIVSSRECIFFKFWMQFKVCMSTPHKCIH